MRSWLALGRPPGLPVSSPLLAALRVADTAHLYTDTADAARTNIFLGRLNQELRADRLG